ncbi:MAG: TolC family protein [Gammaproteobacteria bacterium]|nr:TolC family protein [Gammaproteobacteria bacterium]NNJ49173.1 TolC family protein [Gammaproteobacteria bacterium]
MSQSRLSNYSVNRILVSPLLLASAVFISSNVFALDLPLAEQLAIDSDPSIESFRVTALSYEDASVADDTLPDPRLRLGAVNVPLDSFDLEQEQMTQLKVGIRQDFPRGDVLSIKQQQSQYLSRAALSMADDARLKILRDVRETYLNLFYEVSAYQIIRETRQLFSELVKITESNYAAGRVNQQDVILAGLELARLDDRSTKIKAREESNRVRLSQWIGDVAWNDIDNVFPPLPTLPEEIDLNEVIPQHPLIRAESAKVNASKQMTEMARQEYKPGWSLLLDYGYRSGNNPDGSERTDFATAIVSLDVPLFTGNRQDRKVSANEKKISAARYIKDDQLRKLKQMYEKNHYLWQRLHDRERLYKNSLLTAARNNSKASLKAYQSGVTEFNTLMRAEITELDVRLEDLRVRVDRAVAQANILYILGGTGYENL